MSGDSESPVVGTDEVFGGAADLRAHLEINDGTSMTAPSIGHDGASAIVQAVVDLLAEFTHLSRRARDAVIEP